MLFDNELPFILEEATLPTWMGKVHVSPVLYQTIKH